MPTYINHREMLPASLESGAVLEQQEMTDPMQHKHKPGLKPGDPYVWLGGAAVAVTLLLFISLITVVLVHGLGSFWIPQFTQFRFEDGRTVLGAVKEVDDDKHRVQLYIANRDLNGLDYRWLNLEALAGRSFPQDVILFERRENGNFVGYMEGLRLGDQELRLGHEALWPRFHQELALMIEAYEETEDMLVQLTRLNQRLARLKLEAKKTRNGEKLRAVQARGDQYQAAYEKLNAKMETKRREQQKNVVLMRDENGHEKAVVLVDIIRAYRPNRMGVLSKIGAYVGKVKELVLGNPRESNTEGGLFPAILGTILMVMLMSLFCVPLGVIAAVYLREYADDGLAVKMVRIAVNNLAGVPSIVYGMFGLGFFVYWIGGGIDNLFFHERLPLPTFGTGGLLWASITMALLTVPVVIVSTEEGLSSVPQGVRDGSLALGATKFQTLTRVILPMATPGVLTGLILAIARAAGEVAPLMLVGVVKSVHALPVTSEFPYLQLETKFMHLGFHIFDVGFQSPNVEAAKPMVYVTTLLLLILVLGMSFLAMYLRNRMKKRYMLGAF